MKKCPVCGVEHSDIVPVCSICGSPLTDVVPIPDSAPAPAENGVTLSETSPEAPKAESAQVEAPKAEAPASEPAPQAEAQKPADVSMADIQAVVSSVVSSTVKFDEPVSGGKSAEDSKPAEDDEPFDEDSPFVVNAMRDPSAKKTASAAETETKSAAIKSFARRPRQRSSAANTASKQQQKKPASSSESQAKDPTAGIDTTVVAAASAQKVYEAKHNAEAARAAQEKGKSGQTAQEGEFNWSERKHTREKSKTSTPVIAAVCALLALLIIAMVMFLGSMLTGEDNSDQANGDSTSLTDEESGNSDATADADTDADYVIPDTEDTENTGDETVDATDETEEMVDETGDITDETGDTTDETGDTTDETGNATDETGDDTTDETDDATAEETDDTTAELPAITEVNETVYATASVYVRDYPSSETGNIINGLSVGQSVTRTGTTATGWSRITLNGTDGYVFSSYLSTTAVSTDDDDDDSSSSTTVYTTTGVNLRSEPNGTVIATLGSGQAVTLTGVTSGNWTQITVNGLTGYVYTSYLSTSASSSSDSSSDSSSSSDNVSITETNDTVYATTGVYVRDYPSASTGNVVTTLTKGRAVTRLGTTSNGWSKITVGGVTGYVYSSYLTTSSSSSSDSSDSSGSTTVTGYILPYSNSKYYTASELSGLSKSQLRLARNEIYARHGRKFTNSDLQAYFDSCSWYSGTIDAATFDANVSSYLNSYELANLKLIVELENS